MYMEGNGLKQDDAAAASLLRKACERRDATGCFNFAFMLENGRGIAADVPRALGGYEQACKGDMVLACSKLGVMLVNQLDDLDPSRRSDTAARAVRLLERGCSGGVAMACANQAWMFESGSAGEQNLSRAAQLYTRACDGGAWFGCSGSATCSCRGKGMAANQVRAVTLYAKGCEAGYAPGLSGVRTSAGPEARGSRRTSIGRARRSRRPATPGTPRRARLCRSCSAKTMIDPRLQLDPPGRRGADQAGALSRKPYTWRIRPSSNRATSKPITAGSAAPGGPACQVKRA